MSNNANFTAMLKKGMVMEDIALDYLLDAYPDHYIIPTHDFKTGAGKGPRILQQHRKDIILPDIMMIHSMSKETMLVEVKRKKKTFCLAATGTARLAGVEEYKIQDYRQSAIIMNADLFYIVGDDSKGELHMVPDQSFHIHNFNNQYSKVDTCCIELSDTTVVETY